ncbi:hypothetical protein OGQ57_003237 [Escherichia coli]|nr:hypothetical protein [Escherichia coli]EJY6192110.1 hypothetical protein [Escherichia coli]
MKPGSFFIQDNTFTLTPSARCADFSLNGEGWLIGWRSLWYTWGQKETGEWQWTFQVGDLENVNITHWAVMPKAPEAGA